METNEIVIKDIKIPFVSIIVIFFKITMASIFFSVIILFMFALLFSFALLLGLANYPM